ncbi:MAG: nuclear transport factor 2 family protein [Chitinophagaceae bacterium]
MKARLTILLLSLSLGLAAQTNEVKLINTMKQFHQDLISKNTVSINQQTDKALTYGHSNGWVETKIELLKDLETGVISYQQFKEDSISVFMNGNIAAIRFVANVNASMKSIASAYRLKVLEIWIKKSNRWILFARQAVKA